MRCVGYAIVTETQAALWTDGRYFSQADQQMDCNWILMKIGNDSEDNIFTDHFSGRVEQPVGRGVCVKMFLRHLVTTIR